ncbi:hypothetical protein ATCC90586_000289 [Pythium insidiosum]|nr:hypothetical protein ATCC90586_000289 [Pythium insidiosum]
MVGSRAMTLDKSKMREQLARRSNNESESGSHVLARRSIGKGMGMEVRAWEKIHPQGDAYSPRTGHTVASNVHDRSMYIFGGYDGRDGNYFNDLFYFNFDCNFGSRLVENSYFRQMELGIWFANGALGILHACARNRWYFVFGSQALRHRKDIRLGQAFEIHTRIIHWDDDWLYVLAHFRCPDTGEVFAEGLTRAMLRHGRERVDPRLLYDEMGLTGVVDKEEVPEFVQKFLAWDAESEKSMKHTADFNAVRCANSKRPSLLSAYSMNLPFLQN